MESRRLGTFREVARTLNFTRAAANLSYAQSSVTAQVKALEDELGVPLFDRLGKRVVLTGAGERFLGYAERMLELEEEARAAVAAGDEPVGTVTVSAAETHCTYRLPAILRGLKERFPRVRVVLRPVPVGAFCGDTARGLSDGGVDVAFVLDEPVRASDLEVEPLVEEPISVLVGPDHPLARSPLVGPADLEGETLLLTGTGCSYRRLFERALLAEGLRPRTVQEFSGVEAIKQCAIAGMGVAVLPAVAATGEIGDGRLVALPWASGNLRLVTQAARHGGRWLSPAVRVFLRVAREVLAPGEDACAVQEHRGSLGLAAGKAV